MFYPLHTVLMRASDAYAQPDKFLPLDGSHCARSRLPKGLFEYYDKYKLVTYGRSIPFVTNVASMMTSTGRIVSSGASDRGIGVMGMPQFAFLPPLNKPSELDVRQQWICNDLSPVYIGHIFNDDQPERTLMNVRITGRVGIVGSPAVDTPLPKIIQIQGTHSSINDTPINWENITDKLTVPKTEWAYLQPLEMDFSKQAAKLETWRGYRLVIFDWYYDGVVNRAQLCPGLYRIQFDMAEDRDVLQLPKFEAPAEHVYCLDLQPFQHGIEVPVFPPLNDATTTTEALPEKFEKKLVEITKPLTIVNQKLIDRVEALEKQVSTVQSSDLEESDDMPIQYPDIWPTACVIRCGEHCGKYTCYDSTHDPKNIISTNYVFVSTDKDDNEARVFDLPNNPEPATTFLLLNARTSGGAIQVNAAKDQRIFIALTRGNICSGTSISLASYGVSMKLTYDEGVWHSEISAPPVDA